MEDSKNLYSHIFKAQQNAQLKPNFKSKANRLRRLKSLKKAIEVTFRAEIIEAMKSDFNKPKVETELTEIYQILTEIRYAELHLSRWMRKQSVKTPLSLLGARSSFIYQPKGVCLIISPWNFPFNLTFGPLVSALASGNSVIIKPSEITTNASKLISKIISSIYTQEEVVVIEGGVNVSTELLKLPFNHIFFTGSPRVGKLVMKAAAENLASITLELGGKSPTIIDDSVNLNRTAKRIVWGKLLNAGQICVAPDYVLIKEGLKDEFVSYCSLWISKFFNDNVITSNSYASIVSVNHFNRLKNYIENVKNSKAKIEYGGSYDINTRKIEPTIISELESDNPLLTDEIFGPILPLVTYKNIDEAINFINAKPNPLALYIYSNKKSVVNKIINSTKAGGTCVNINIIHFSNHHLPFGGVNNSGIGDSHGFFGFQTFSNKRAVLKQGRFTILDLLNPPYTNFKEFLARFTIKWF